MPNLYIIAGCNGAGKTTASYTILPDVLNCREFVNADNIAAGISPFNPEGAMAMANEIMTERVDTLLSQGKDLVIDPNGAAINIEAAMDRAENLGYAVYPDIALPPNTRFQQRVSGKVGKSIPAIPEELENKSLLDKISYGLKLAAVRFSEERAANNEMTVISDGANGVKWVSAREVVAARNQEERNRKK